MQQSASERLKKLGLDIDFLVWLEGEEQRLPDIDPIRGIKDADFAAAIRTAAWIGSFFSDERLTDPDEAMQWLARYQRLELYLQSALKTSVFYRSMSAQDLAKLEEVLGTLLPPSLWDEYRKDFARLRRQGLPPDIPAGKAKRSGGIRQTEQTWRMRAAVYLISRKSKTYYADLARLWNERLGPKKYTAEMIKDRLRKGHFLSRTEGAAERALKFWLRVYHGDFRHVFPGPFPLSPKLSEVHRKRVLRSKSRRN